MKLTKDEIFRMALRDAETESMENLVLGQAWLSRVPIVVD